MFAELCATCETLINTETHDTTICVQVLVNAQPRIIICYFWEFLNGGILFKNKF